MRKNPGLDLIIVFKTVASAYIVEILKFSFLANSLYRLGSEEVTTIVSIQNEINCSSSLISGIIFLSNFSISCIIIINLLSDNDSSV